MCGIYNDYIDMGFYQCIDTVHHVSSNTNSSTTKQSALVILCG